MKKRTRKNPQGEEPIYLPRRGVIIANMVKIPGHPCDAKCKKAGHRFEHKFETPVEVIGLPDGNVLLKAGKKK